MQNLIIDDGYKEFSINGDENRVIRFNPSDFSIIERINTAYEEINKATDIDTDIELKPDGKPVSELEKVAEIVSGINTTIKKQIDYIFNSPVSDAVFGNQSPLSMVKGMPLYERFLNAVVPIIRQEVAKEQEASRKRIEKYTKQVK
jgi:hypothetical protein